MTPVAEAFKAWSKSGLGDLTDGCEWRTIPSAPRYEASSEGRVRMRDPNRRKFDPLPGTVNLGGYIVHTIYQDGQRRQWKAHRLVCEAFHGPAPDGLDQVAHWDGDKTNNRPENLRWTDTLGNNRDRLRHGKYGTHARLTREDRRKIRELHGPPRGRGKRGNPTQTDLAEMYGVTQAHIARIVKDRS